MAEKDKIPIEPVTAAAPRVATQLRLQAVAPKRRRRFTAGDELRAFVFLLMVLLMLVISVVSRTEDPVAAFLGLFAPFLP